MEEGGMNGEEQHWLTAMGDSRSAIFTDAMQADFIPGCWKILLSLFLPLSLFL